jgi:hypothetical protein
VLSTRQPTRQYQATNGCTAPKRFRWSNGHTSFDRLLRFAVDGNYQLSAVFGLTPQTRKVLANHWFRRRLPLDVLAVGLTVQRSKVKLSMLVSFRGTMTQHELAE